MEFFLAFLKGLLIGLAIAIPVGPIAILCVQRSLHNGFKIGLMTGFGAALADGFYGFIAAFGLTSVSSLLVSHQLLIRIFGGLFLIYLGIKLFFTPAAKKPARFNNEKSSLHAFTTTFLLTIANPTTVLAFIAIFAGLGIGTANTNYSLSLTLVLGIFLGSAIWWIFLAAIVTRVLHHRLTSNLLRMINKIAGSIIFIFGLAALLVALTI